MKKLTIKCKYDNTTSHLRTAITTSGIATPEVMAVVVANTINVGRHEFGEAFIRRLKEELSGNVELVTDESEE